MSERLSHRKVIAITSIAAVIMFGFCFAIVPFYSLICKATGINTSIPDPQLLTPAYAGTAKQTVDESREVLVQFVAVNHMGLPWDFYPKVKTVSVHPGAQNKIYFYARNATDNDMTVQAIPSMTPPEAIGHFHKIQCFCFNQQSLKAHESKDMVLIFNVDKALPKETHVITLAYTLFDVTPNAKAKKGK